MFESVSCHVATIRTSQSMDKNNHSVNDVLTSSAINVSYQRFIYISSLIFGMFV